MKLTTKLLSYLHGIFDKDPARFLALRLRYAGDAMTWRVQDAMLSTVPIGGYGAPLAVDLTQYTLGELVNYLASQPGYVVEFADHSELSMMGAAVLLDAVGDQDKSNGDHLYGYTNVLWSFMEANARELAEAGRQVEQMRLQMSTTTASDVWLDELGGYYGVPRLQSEADSSYGLRIIAEVLRPRSNNIAIEAAIRAYTGQVTKVTDVVVNSAIAPLYNAADTYNGSRTYNSGSSPVYGLFDVEYGYDIINNGNIVEFAGVIRDLINRLRAAGTQLRALSLMGSLLTDATDPPQDASSMDIGLSVSLSDAPAPADDAMDVSRLFLSTLADQRSTGIDSMSFTISAAYKYNGQRTYNGAITYAGSVPVTEVSNGETFEPTTS